MVRPYDRYSNPLSHGPCWVGRVRSLRQLPRVRLSVIARDTEVPSEKQASCQSTCTRPLVSQPLKLAY